MRRRTQSAVLGAIVLGAIALAAGMMFLWASERLTGQSFPYVSSFRGSAGGLDVGNAVTFRDVKVGEITGVQLRLARTEGESPIVVSYELQADRLRDVGARPPSPEVMREVVRAGLRAQLGYPSLLTGERPVELAYVRQARPAELEWDPEWDAFEIPTADAAPGRGGALLEQLRDADIAGLVEEMKELAQESRQTMRAARAGLRSGVVEEMKELAQESQQTMRAARASLRGMRASLRDVQALFGHDAPLIVEIRRNLAAMAEAAKSVGELANYLLRNPDALIRGRSEGTW